jgi:hypothetical protein
MPSIFHAAVALIREGVPDHASPDHAQNNYQRGYARVPLPIVHDFLRFLLFGGVAVAGAGICCNAAECAAYMRRSMTTAATDSAKETLPRV